MNVAFDDNVKACAALVQKADPDRFLAAMAAPVSARAKLFPLYALNVEVARAPWVTQEPMIAEMRLQWWRDALQEIADGAEVRRHEVLTPLVTILSPHLAGILDEYIAVRRWDIYRDPFEDVEHFDNYMEQSSSTPLLVAAQVLGSAEESVVRDFGYATGVANWFRAVPELEARGRIPMLDGTPKGVSYLAQKAMKRLLSAQGRRSEVSRQARPAMFVGWQTKRILELVLQNPHRVASGALRDSEVRRKASLMWVVATGRW